MYIRKHSCQVLCTLYLEGPSTSLVLVLSSTDGASARGTAIGFSTVIVRCDPDPSRGSSRAALKRRLMVSARWAARASSVANDDFSTSCGAKSGQYHTRKDDGHLTSTTKASRAQWVSMGATKLSTSTLTTTACLERLSLSLTPTNVGTLRP